MVERTSNLHGKPALLNPRAGHPFCQKLNELLAEAKFDTWIESRGEGREEGLITQLVGSASRLPKFFSWITRR